MPQGDDAFCRLLFEASNEDRLRIINLLSGEPLSLTTLSKRVGIGTQEVSRHVSRLTEAKIIRRGSDGLNHVTPYGRLALEQFSGLKFVSENQSYFDDHPLAGLPVKFINRLGELAESTYLEDAMLVLDHIEAMIRESERYVYRITDSYLTSYFPVIEDALRRGVEYNLLSPEDVAIPPNFRFGPIMTEANFSGQFVAHSIPGPDVFLAMSEKEVAALGFRNAKGKLDYYSFSSRDQGFHEFCLDLFNYYWDRSEAKSRDNVYRFGTLEKE